MAQKRLPERTAVPNKRLGSPSHPNVGERSTKRVKSNSAINSAPSKKLDVYVFGVGDCGELGLGPTIRNGKKPRRVQRPRLNDLLDASSVGVVQIAVGGMHCVALTEDQKILTWGVNDNGALGRDTAWEAPTRGIDEDDEDEDEEDSLNPKESTPIAIPEESFGPDKKTFTQVAATDSASFVLTDDGFVYGWGTFGVSFFLSSIVPYSQVRETMVLSAFLQRMQSKQ
jgi:regulator of chromosome condensation